jgi:putative ABC transport system ATP-binding protein
MPAKFNDPPVIRVHEVTKEYSDNGVPVRALRGVELSIARGEFTALAGPSGSGKTTLLNIVSGLDTVSSGEVWLDGQLLSGLSGRQLSDFRRDHIGFVFQAYNLIPVLSVSENVEYIMLLQGVASDVRRARVEKLLERLGLAGMANRLPTQLSGGQQQRVAVARAMVSEPSLVLADEPTANLDTAAAVDLIELMKELNAETGMTFVFATHDQRMMQRARRLVTMVDGRIDSDALQDDAG